MEYLYKYTNRYHDIKSPMHKTIYEKFIKKNIHCDFSNKVFDHNDMMCNYFDNYLYDCKNVNDLILNYKQILTNVMSCMFVLNIRMQVIHHVFDSIVEYIIENNCYSEFEDIDHLIMIFTYISPEKLYDYITYLYNSSNEEKKKYLNENLSNKIYLTILYNSAIITITQYGYANIENIGDIVHPYYLLVKKLNDDQIIIEFDQKMIKTEYDLIECNRNSDHLYYILFTNIYNDRNIHLKKIIVKK